MKKEYPIYCPRKCPISKHCFIVKLAEEPKIPIKAWHKCQAVKGDILIEISDKSIRPP